MTNGQELSLRVLIDRSARVLQHPGWVPETAQEPMKNSNSEAQESSDRQLIKEIYQMNDISLGEGPVTCQVCCSFLRAGKSVVVYVFRPAGEVTFQLGYITCSNEEHDLPEEYTLGVREVVVAGRVGWCSDVATQSSWRVLLEPEVLAVSAAGSKSLRERGDEGAVIPDETCE